MASSTFDPPMPCAGGSGGASLHHVHSAGHAPTGYHNQASFQQQQQHSGAGAASSSVYAAAATVPVGGCGPAAGDGPASSGFGGAGQVGSPPAGGVPVGRRCSGGLAAPEGPGRPPSPLTVQFTSEEMGPSGRGAVQSQVVSPTGGVGRFKQGVAGAAGGTGASSGQADAGPSTVAALLFKKLVVEPQNVVSAPGVGPNGELGPAESDQEVGGERVTIGRSLSRVGRERRGAWQSVIMGLEGPAPGCGAPSVTRSTSLMAGSSANSAGAGTAAALTPAFSRARSFGRPTGAMFEAVQPLGGAESENGAADPLLQPLVDARVSSHPNLSQLRLGAFGAARLSQVASWHGMTAGMAVSGSDDDSDDDESESDESEWQSSDSDDPIGLLRKQRKAAASQAGKKKGGVSNDVGSEAAAAANGEMIGCSDYPPAAGGVSPSGPRSGGLGPPSQSRLSAQSSQHDCAPTAGALPSRTPSYHAATAQAWGAGSSARNADAASPWAGPDGPAAAAQAAAPQGASAADGDSLPVGGGYTVYTPRWSIAGHVEATGPAGGPLGARGAPGARSLRNVVNATLAARRVAGAAGGRARRASYTGDLHNAPGAGSKSAGGGAGLLTAMTHLNALGGGGKKARKGRKGGAMKGEWLQELQQAVQHTVIVSEVRRPLPGVLVLFVCCMHNCTCL